MDWPRRKLLTLLDVGVILGGTGPGGGTDPPPVLNNAGVWYRADRGTTTPALAAQYVAANSESLTANIALNSVLQIPPTSPWTMGGWIWLNTTGVIGTVGFPGMQIYDDSIRWRLGITTSAGYDEINMSGAGTHSLGAWHFLIFGFDPTQGGGTQWGRQDNIEEFFGRKTARGTFPTAASGDMAIGVSGFSGRMQNWFLFSRYFNDADCAYIYNAGAGRSYDELTSAFKSGLRAWWPLNEVSGNRRDQSGNNVTLTDVNTVSSAAGLIVNSPGNGSPIDSWDDSGPNDFWLGQGIVAGQPTLQVNERNGLPVLRFDGVDDFMESIALIPGSALCGPTAQTVFIVQMQHSSDTASTTYGWDNTAIGGNNLGAHLKYTDNVLYYDTGSAVGVGRLTATAPEPWKGTWHIVEMVRDGTTNSSFTIEGNPVSAYTAQPTAAFNPAPSSRLRMAEHAGALAANIFQGDIAEFIMFNRTLTIPERTIVRNYLQNKWGISSNKLVVNNTRTGYVLVNSTTNDRVAVTM